MSIVQSALDDGYGFAQVRLRLESAGDGDGSADLVIWNPGYRWALDFLWIGFVSVLTAMRVRCFLLRLFHIDPKDPS